jgi:hypothetical protein
MHGFAMLSDVFTTFLIDEQRKASVKVRKATSSDDEGESS